MTSGPAGELVGFSVFGSTALRDQGRLLLGADRPVYASAALAEDTLRLALTCDEPCRITVWCPSQPITTTVDAAPATPAWDAAGSLASFSVSAGAHECSIALQAP